MVNTIESSPKDTGLADTESSDSPWDDIAKYSDRESNNAESAEKLDEKEAELKKELVDEYKSVTAWTKMAYGEISDIFSRYSVEKPEQALNALEHFVINKDRYDEEIVNSMFDLVDEYFPSAESGKVRVPERIRGKERDYLDANTNNGKYCSSVLEAIGENFVIGDPNNDKDAAEIIDSLSNGTMAQSNMFPDALLGYLKDPSEATKSELDKLNDNYIELVTGSIYDIVDCFDQDKTPIKRALFEPMTAFAGSTGMERGALYEKLKEYLDYKIQNTRDEYKPKEKENASFDALPDDVIS